ncbi:MAG: flagellar export chaperone FlgN [Planctomycetes bacterium]|nr:flagellar export chaperone FlgN [Planctomycetota bacterium]
MNHDRITAICRDLIRQEEALLTGVLVSLHGLRAGLLAGDWKQLAVGVQGLHELSEKRDANRSARQDSRVELGVALGLRGAAATFEQAFRALPSHLAEPLRSARDRLGRLAREVQLLNHASALLTQYVLDFLQRFFVELAGGHADSLRYGPDGALRSPACGSLIQARG